MQVAAGGTDFSLLDTVALATLLDMSVSAINKWRGTGEGPPFIRVGRCVRYRRSDVDAWLTANRCRSTSEGPRAA